MPRRVGRRAAIAALVGACADTRGVRPAARVLREGEDGSGNLLRWLGTIVMEAEGTAGLSGLHVAEDLTLHAVTDIGRWFRARLVLGADGAPLGLEDVAGGALRDPLGRRLGRGVEGDAECLAALPDGGWLVGFERAHRIWRYPRLDGPAEVVESPPGLDDAPYNGGLEALAVLSDGRWLAVAERLVPQRGVRATARPGSAGRADGAR
ncbi:esterase-like activity of phytase family protein [Roseomonas sp. CCTCC AB2023176]|uniref:esterase-like activity of phytase family protein n=1 Tax=Roseomonas sp. CCTCC AB2023176 TaxID=3342640 RepID=UPI0035DA29FC